MKNYKELILKIIFLIGILLLLYPIVGKSINRYIQKHSINKYVETVNIISDDKTDDLYKKAMAYNEKVYIRQRDNKRYNLGKEYEEILKVDSTSIMGYIDIPKANIKLPIYHGVEENVLQKGVGHVKESSLPIGTINQNSMLMGHSGLPTSSIFNNLEKLEVDDYIKITILHKELYYKIFAIEVIEPSELLSRIAIIEGKDLITLVTCTPYGINSHRLVIHAERTEDIIEDTKTHPTINLFIIIISIIILVGVGAYLLIKNKKIRILESIKVTLPNKSKDSAKKVETKTRKTTTKKTGTTAKKATTKKAGTTAKKTDTTPKKTASKKDSTTTKKTTTKKTGATSKKTDSKKINTTTKKKVTSDAKGEVKKDNKSSNKNKTSKEVKAKSKNTPRKRVNKKNGKINEEKD